MFRIFLIHIVLLQKASQHPIFVNERCKFDDEGGFSQTDLIFLFIVILSIFRIKNSYFLMKSIFFF